MFSRKRRRGQGTGDGVREVGMKRGRATSLDSYKATIPVRPSPAGAQIEATPSGSKRPLRHAVCFRSQARFWQTSRLRSNALVRTAVAGLPALPRRLVALRHIVPASSRSLRRVVGGRRVLFRPALPAVALRSCLPSCPPSAPSSIRCGEERRVRARASA